ncbi:MAG: glutamate decarboxylase [Nitrospiraceae bacterium]|nr:glutamate decarboxylase [Nitrospiraceae bacterium]
MLSRKAARSEQEIDPSLAPVYSARDLSEEIPRYRLPERSSSPRVVAQLIEDELNLDGNASLNLASFVTTWMEPEAESLMARTLSKNFVDAEEYPQTAELADRCVNMIADLFHAPDETGATGTATVGSSEAIHLAGLAMKWRWKKLRGAAAGSATPNIVMGANVQVCWEKFARYFEVEPRYVPMTPTRYVLSVDEALSLVDENTIGVVGILGSTYTGEYEPIQELASALDQLQDERDLDIPIHVDAASGGFVAPFNSPELTWDFRLPRVKSINTSGHKYGLVYPGIGWSLWREAELLPDELIFHVNYLGGDHPTFNLNFSRGSSQIVAQYYNLLRLGRQGYAKVMGALASTATWISSELQATGRFTILSKTDALPVVCFRLTSEESWTVFDLSAALRERGWIVPAYTLAPNASEIAVLRIVVREGLGRDVAETLLSDIRAAIERLDAGHVPAPPVKRGKGAGSTRHVRRHHNPGHGVC